MAAQNFNPMQAALFGGQPTGRRQRYQRYYDENTDEGQTPIEVPEQMPEPDQVSPVANATFPSARQVRPPQQTPPMESPMENSYRRQGGPIDQLYNPQGMQRGFSPQTPPAYTPANRGASQYRPDDYGQPVQGQPQQQQQQPPADTGGTRAWRGFTNQGGQWGGGQYNPNAIQQGDYTSQLEGFNLDKLNEAHEDSNSLKYVFAKAASGVDVKQPGATQAVVERLRQMGVNAAVENPDGEADRIVFLDTGESIDVMRGGANVGQEGWQWIDAQYGGQPAPGQGVPLGGAQQPGYLDPNDPLAQALIGRGIQPGTEIWDMLMAQLSKQASGGGGSTPPLPQAF